MARKIRQNLGKTPKRQMLPFSRTYTPLSQSPLKGSCGLLSFSSSPLQIHTLAVKCIRLSLAAIPTTMGFGECQAMYVLGYLLFSLVCMPGSLKVCQRECDDNKNVFKGEWARETNLPKTFFFWGGGGGKCHDNKNLTANLIVKHFWSNNFVIIAQVPNLAGAEKVLAISRFSSDKTEKNKRGEDGEGRGGEERSGWGGAERRGEDGEGRRGEDGEERKGWGGEERRGEDWGGEGSGGERMGRGGKGGEGRRGEQRERRGEETRKARNARKASKQTSKQTNKQASKQGRKVGWVERKKEGRKEGRRERRDRAT